MIIATKNIDVRKVCQIYSDSVAFREYILSLIPKIYHHTGIVGNQIFYINSVILRDESIPIDRRREIGKTILHDNRVCGVLGEFIEIRTIERRVNKNKVNRFHEEVN